MCYVNGSKYKKMIGWVGDDLSSLTVDICRCRFRWMWSVIAIYFRCTYQGLHTRFPVAGASKRQGCVSHSTPPKPKLLQQTSCCALWVFWCLIYGPLLRVTNPVLFSMMTIKQWSLLFVVGRTRRCDTLNDLMEAVLLGCMKSSCCRISFWSTKSLRKWLPTFIPKLSVTPWHGSVHVCWLTFWMIKISLVTKYASCSLHTMLIQGNGKRLFSLRVMSLHSRSSIHQHSSRSVGSLYSGYDREGRITGIGGSRLHFDCQIAQIISVGSPEPQPEFISTFHMGFETWQMAVCWISQETSGFSAYQWMGWTCAVPVSSPSDYSPSSPIYTTHGQLILSLLPLSDLPSTRQHIH